MCGGAKPRDIECNHCGNDRWFLYDGNIDRWYECATEGCHGVKIAPGFNAAVDAADTESA